MKTYSLFSVNRNDTAKLFPIFDREEIKKEIIRLLTEDPTDQLEFCREFTKEERKKYVGNEIIDFYEVNPKSGKPSKIILKGDKQYYKPLTETPLPF